MLSTIPELAGLACLATAAFLLGGVPACLIVGGLELLLVGFALSPLAARPKSSKRG